MKDCQTLLLLKFMIQLLFPNAAWNGENQHYASAFGANAKSEELVRIGKLLQEAKKACK
jgi:hypothetical protein